MQVAHPEPGLPGDVTSPSRVLAVLVVHDGGPWLEPALAALEAQTHPGIEVVAVDNASTDGSQQVLLDHLEESAVLVAERDLGFGAAVSMALDARPARDAPYVLLAHDDCALEPDAVSHLVAALEGDPRLAMVGPKLRAWDDPSALQSVGWTVDLTGRADSGVDEGELDQGQRDQERRSLYVSTSGMLLRRTVLDELGRFDRRFHLFRDDLDLCWRAWIAGHDVEVVPEAVGAHVAGAANYLRLGQTGVIGPRYFAERNTLAALLKNYGAARLTLVVPLYFLVGIAKVLGFVLTRRVSDAWQTVRAWLWNAYHLRETARLRREVQRTRTRSDAELAGLFGRIGPRAQAYLEVMADWVAGGDVGTVEESGSPPEPTMPGSPPEPTMPGSPSSSRARGTAAGANEPEPAWRRARRFVRRRPVLTTAVLLSVLMVVAAAPLLASGPIRGGELAPWPSSPLAFLGDYGDGWHTAGGLGTAQPPAPAQALLGLFQGLVGGSAYLASRLLLLGLVAAAWLLALRAAQAFSRRRLPRIAAASAYVLSPPALAALATGRVGALVLLATTPALVAAGATLLRPSAPPERAWRAVAAVVLLGAGAGAFEPIALVMLVLVGLVGLTASLIRSGDAAVRRALVARAAVAGLAPMALLLPWSATLLDADGLLRAGGGEVVTDPLWRWLVLSPELAGMPGLIAGAGFLLAGLLGLALGAPRRPWLAAGLWSAALIGALAAWWLGRIGASTWPGLGLVVTAGAFAGLLALAFASAEAHLTSHDFGWRQLAALTTIVGIVASLGTGAVTLLERPWDAYAVDDGALPAFVTAAADEEGPFRVLVLAEQGGDDRAGVTDQRPDAGGSDEGPGVDAQGDADVEPGSSGAEPTVSFEVVDGEGPTMAGYGVPPSEALEVVEEVVDDTLSGRDAGAAGRLGALGIRYVVVPGGGIGDTLDGALREQLSLEPRPVADGRVFSVASWLPAPAAIVDEDTVTAIERSGRAPTDLDIDALERRAEGWVGSSGDGGTLTVAETPDPGWIATAGGQLLDPDPDADTLRYPDVPAGETVRVRHRGEVGRDLVVAGQLLGLLLAISLALRPPRFARRRRTGASDGDDGHPPRAAPASQERGNREVLA